MRIRDRLSLALAASLAGASPALSQTRTESPASAYGPAWTGFYIGAAIGVDTMVDHTNLTAGSTAVSNDLGGTGALGSIYGGIDYQIAPKILVGALAELSYGGLDSTASASAPGASASLSTHADWSWAAMARAGVLATPATLLYAMGGYAGQNIQTTANAGGASFSSNDTFNGWTVGGGIESILGHGWSTKFEYRYSEYGSKTLSGTTLSLSPSTHAARLGLTYHFGGVSAASPVDDPAPATTNTTSWTGFYGGALGGVGAMTNNRSASVGSASATTNNGGQGLLGGLFAGADYQFAPQALVGVMGDYSWTGLQSNSSTSLGGATATATTRQNNAWSVLGRLGFLPTPSTLLYAAAGYTGASFTSTASAGGLFTTRDGTLGGWTLGPGVEMMISDGWSTRLEYRYSQFAAVSSNGVTGQASTQTVRAGLAYRFGVK